MAVTTPAATPSVAARAAIEDVTREMSGELHGIARDLTDEIHAKVPGLDAELHASTLRSTRANVGVILAMLADHSRPSVVAPPLEALAYAREYVRRGIALEVLLRAYRAAQARFSRIWLERLQTRVAGAEELAGTFGFISDWLFDWVDALELRLSEYYVRERTRGLRGAKAARAEEVRAILDGRSADEARASGRLRYELRREHVAFVVWSEDGSGAGESDAEESLRAMEHLAGELARAMGAVDHLVASLDGYLSCWAGLREAPALDALPSVVAAGARDGLHVALGEVGGRLQGFRRSHEEALRARRVVRLAPLGAGTCARFADVALDALLTGDPDEAGRFVRSELGPLVEDTAAAARLRETLVTFLEESGSFLHAAQRLGVHENTVAYRVHRAEGLLGRPVKERGLELRCALRLARLAPPGARRG